jgi:hypothetical protein
VNMMDLKVFSLKNTNFTILRKGEQRMEIADLAVFGISLVIVIAGGIVVIKEILKGGKE